MPPDGLEEHHPPYYYQKPLKKQDFLSSMKAQVFGRDCGENREGGEDDQSPLDSEDKASWPGGDIVQTVYQVTGSLHDTISRYAAHAHSMPAISCYENGAIA